MGVCLTLLSAVAHPKSVGVTFSFTGPGLVYEHSFDRYASFIEVSLKAETSEYILDRKRHPGLSAGITWNTTLKEWASCEGNTLRFFAGPGIIGGYGADYKSDKGVFLGLKGRIGLECDFMRNVLLSVAVSPVVGAHLTSHQGDLSMKYYINGVIWALVPEIGVKYRF